MDVYSSRVDCHPPPDAEGGAVFDPLDYRTETRESDAPNHRKATQTATRTIARLDIRLSTKYLFHELVSRKSLIAAEALDDHIGER